METRWHLTADLGDDGGTTWTGGLLLDEHKNVSYPGGIQDKDGVIRIIDEFECTKEKRILMAAFTENDVAAGKPSGTTRLRVPINQATGVAPAKTHKPAAKVP